MQSEPAWWNYFTNPATPYAERLAAAYQGAKLLSPQEMPKLWEAMAALEETPTGVNPSPCSYYISANMTPEMWVDRKEHPSSRAAARKPETRYILGSSVQLPTQAVDYPLTENDFSSIPWLWQMEQALRVLKNEVRFINSRDSIRYAVVAGIAFKWKAEGFWEQRERIEAITSGPQNTDWVRSVTKLAVEEGTEVRLSLTIYASFHVEELAHAAQIVILQNAKSASQAAGIAIDVGELAHMKPRFDSKLQPMETATATLVIAKWANDTALHSRSRYLFARNICDFLGEPPPVPNPLNPSGPDPGVEKLLNKCETWFAGQRPALEEKAAEERPHLEELAAELGQKLR
jgi:hypothetical protein